MMRVLIVLTHLFEFLSVVSGLLFGASFTPDELKKYPILDPIVAELKGNRLLLLIFAIVFLAISRIANAWKESLGKKEPVIVFIRGSQGELIPKATLTGFKRELVEAAAERVREVEDYFNVAERRFASNRYRDAASNYQKSIGVFPTMSAYLNLGISLSYVSHFPEAEDAFISGLQIARKKHHREFEGLFLGNIGIVYFRQGNLDEALKSYEAAFKIFEEISIPLGQANTFVNIGNIYRSQGKLDEALKSHKAALDIYKEIDNLLGQANVLGNISNVYFNQGKLDEALKSHKAALEIDKEIGNPQGQANDLGNIGTVYAEQGKLDEALKSHKAALEIHKEIDNLLGQANALGSIGIVYKKWGKQEEALSSYRAALEIHKEIGNPLGQANDLGNIGTVYAEHGRLEEALKSYKAALEIHKEIGNPLGQANDLGNIAHVYANQGKKREVLELLRQAREIYRKIGATRELQTVEKNIDRINAAMDKPDR